MTTTQERDLTTPRRLLERIVSCVDGQGWRSRTEPSKHSELERVVFFPSENQLPEEIFLFELMPPVGASGCWTGDLTLLTNLETLMFSVDGGEWFAHVQKPNSLQDEAIREPLSEELLLEQIERMRAV